MKFFNTATERLERKVDNLTTESAVLKKEMADLKSSMQFHSDTIDQKLLQVDTKVSQIYVANDENIKTLIDNHKNLHVKVRDFRIRAEGIIFGLMGYRKHTKKTGKEVKPKLKSLSR